MYESVAGLESTDKLVMDLRLRARSRTEGAGLRCNALLRGDVHQAVEHDVRGEDLEEPPERLEGVHGAGRADLAP